MKALGFVVIAAAMTMATEAARADNFFSVTTTGTITSGYDAGTFGGIGNLAGQTYSAVEIFDETLSSFSSIAGTQQLLPAYGAALISINGHDDVIGGDPNSSIYDIADYLHLNGNNGSNQDLIFGEIKDASSNFFAVGISSTSVDFLTTDNLAQTLSYTLPSAGVASFGGSIGASEVFLGTINTVKLAAVPEPASIALLGAALAGLGLLRRRQV